MAQHSVSNGITQLRLVLDTHIWLEWLLWQSPRIEPLRVAHAAGSLCLFRSDDTLDEWRRVLGYPQFALPAKRIDELCAQQCALTGPAPSLASDVAEKLPKCRDADDQKFLELSIASAAHYLISRDKKLRKIGRHKFYRAVPLHVITLEAFFAANILPSSAPIADA
jgi:uncharacterized protein